MPISGPRELSEKSILKDVQDLFELQYEYARPFFDEFNKVRLMYDQIIDPATWENEAEITTGRAFGVVQDLLPVIMFYTLWSPEIPFEIIPRNVKTSYETTTRIRDNLVYTQREPMNLEVNGYYAILDALKYGCGYVMVEPRMVIDPDFGTSTAFAGPIMEQVKTLGVGIPKDITSCRYIRSGCVYPSPDGSEPNGPAGIGVSGITVLDFATELEMKQAFMRENSPFEGGEKRANEIIDYAKKNKMNGYYSSARAMADYLTGRKQSLESSMNSRRKNVPSIIPIVKQYRNNRHIWTVGGPKGGFVLLDIGDEFQTLTKPIAKATYSPEGGQWFVKGMVARGYDTMAGEEIWLNSMVDLLGISLHPHRIESIEARSEEDKQEDISAYGVTRVHGDISKAIKFLEWPQMPPQAFTVPDTLRQFTASTVGASMGPGEAVTPGVVRGGSGAVESLLQTSNSRQKATAKHIENGWYKQVCLLTLISQQILTDENNEFTVLKTADESTEGRKPGDKYFEVASITADEIRQPLRFEFNFREKLRNFLAESAHRIQVYGALKDDPRINPEENIRQLVGDEWLANRLLSGVDQKDRMQEIQTLAATGGGQQPQNPAAAGRGVGLGV